MAARRQNRFLHALTILLLIAGNLTAPAQAAVQTLHDAAAREAAAAMVGMDCDDMAGMHDDGMPPASDNGCDCCGPASCDLSVCLGTACLSELPRVLASVPRASQPLTLQIAMPPSRLIETPLRPPIG